MRYCSACGALNDTDAKFCGKCGKQLGVIAAESVAEPAFEASAEPTVEVVTEPTVEVVAEPAVEVVESTSVEPEPVAEPIVENIAPESSEEQMAEPAIEPVTLDDVQKTEENPVKEETTFPGKEETLTGPGQIYNRPVKGRVFGIISFILSLDALTCSFIPFFNIVGIIEAVIALIFCNISKKNTNFKLPRVGSVISWISIGLSIVISVLAFIFIMLFVYMLIDTGAMKDFYKFFELINGLTLID